MANSNVSLPIYTTRPHGPENETASYSQAFWITLAVLWLVELSIVLWSLYGLYTLGRLVFA